MNKVDGWVDDIINAVVEKDDKQEKKIQKLINEYFAQKYSIGNAVS